MKFLAAVFFWAGVGVVPVLVSASNPGSGNFCIDENPNGPDSEVIFTGSGLIIVEICVTNDGANCETSPEMTLKVQCADGTPAPVQIAEGETKCVVCKVQKVTVSDTDPNCEPCGTYVTSYP